MKPESVSPRQSRRRRSPAVSLRNVTESDIEVFFEHQSDDEANRMAAFPARGRDAHAAHWHKILSDDELVAQTIVADGQVAGHIGCWEHDGQHEIGYWLGRDHWGKGIATAALSQFLDLVEIRPLSAHVATHNVGSLRVLEKCGFAIVGRSEEDDVEVTVLILRQ